MSANLPNLAARIILRRPVAAGLCLGIFLAAARWPAQAEELRTVAAVRELPVEQTQQKIPVQLNGVVTFFDDFFFSRFMQDQTAGIYLEFPTNIVPPKLVPGQVIAVNGIASPGEYAPVVLVSRLEVKGGAPLPAARPVTYSQLASGTEDSQFVEITGIVRSVRPVENSPYYLIKIATGGGRLLVFARTLPVEKPEELPDSIVRVRGVCSTQFNHQRQLFAIRLMVPRPDDLQIATPAHPDAFAVAARPIGSLLQFTPQETYSHRVKLAGTVIYFDPGVALFLQDSNHGVEVQTQERSPLAVGDHVEVLGFASQGDYTPLLQDAIYRKTTNGPALTPARLTTDEALKGGHDCQLIEVSARLIDRTQHGSEEFLILQDGNCLFQASLKEQADGRDRFASLENGSRVTVTGVCRIDPGEWEAGEKWRAKSFNILLRSPEDVTLVEAPPWWSLKRVLWFAGALGILMLLAFGWVAVLRRQVTERTRQLETQVHKRQLAERRQLIEEERARVAHDLHDDLGARLTEVNMLTTLVKSPTTSDEEKRRYLGDLSETALRMVTSLDEIVWAMNPRNDTLASLASYFGAYAQRLLDLASVACGLDITEDLPERPLDPKFRQELFFSLKEALTNVVRHARATQAWVRIFVSSDCLVVELADNGCGFDAQQGRQTGNDGIVNMNERLKSLGGRCEITSDARTGTVVRFSAPLPRTFL